MTVWDDVAVARGNRNDVLVGQVAGAVERRKPIRWPTGGDPTVQFDVVLLAPLIAREGTVVENGSTSGSVFRARVRGTDKSEIALHTLGG